MLLPGAPGAGSSSCPQPLRPLRVDGTWEKAMGFPFNQTTPLSSPEMLLFDSQLHRRQTHLSFLGLCLFFVCGVLGGRRDWGWGWGASFLGRGSLSLEKESLMHDTPASMSKGSKKGMWERPLVAVSCKGMWGAPQLARRVMPEGGWEARQGLWPPLSPGLQPPVIDGVFPRCPSARRPPGMSELVSGHCDEIPHPLFFKISAE
uniref:Uncharacterized protein n=2 Tax=Pipistrellus kuhlii TaxID=59472 RepID=A0A7J7S3R1_PIPKU|nr:hypothetical protein mPipKuh1_010182 [Pipistrellus kuhlii]